jgi:serpin B
LNIANSLWVPLTTSSVSATFESADQTYYGATIGDIAQAPADVNAWGNEQTNGLIPQILPPGTNLAQAKAILANVVYFKGTWQSGFSPAQTKSAPFTLANGTQTTVNMMEQAQATFPVVSGANFTAVSLPYGQGRLSMIAVLPNAGVDLGTFVSTLTPADIDSWVGQMSSVSINLFLPRFTTSFSANLIPPLTTLGMGIAFEAGGGDFSGIYPGAYISAVQHDTVVEVDETGTVAAGTTTIVITTSVAIQEPVNVEFNRPFFYTIRDNQTGALLFSGVMVNPNGG